MKRPCLITNYGSSYRAAIYTLMDRELGCDFIFGDSCADIKKMDYSLLKNRVAEVKNISLGPMTWQRGVIGEIFKPYTDYIVLGQPDFISTWALLLLSKFSSKKVLLWTHGWYGREGRVKKIVKKVFFALSDKILVYGDRARELMIEEGLDPRKILAIHNSLDYDNQLDIRKNISPSPIFTNHFSNNNPNLIFIGRLTRTKRLGMILDLLHEANINNKRYNLTYIGTGEVIEELKAKVKSYHLEDQVWFYGQCFHEKELSELIYNADICVSPGNVGLTSIHALTYGCPVITHNNFAMQMPEFEVIKPGITGDFFEYNNLESLMESLDRWFSYKVTREEVRRAAYKIIDKEWNPHYQIGILKRAMEM